MSMEEQLSIRIPTILSVTTVALTIKYTVLAVTMVGILVAARDGGAECLKVTAFASAWIFSLLRRSKESTSALSS
eukprot:11592424-Ditylum_brightwellii.AAC.2